MESLRYKTVLRLVKLLNPVLMTAAFAFCWYQAYADNILSTFYNRGNWVVIAFFFVLYLTYGRVYDSFRISLSRISELVWSQTLALCFTNAIMYVLIWLLTKHLPALWPLLLAMCVQLFFSVAWCYLAHKWYFRVFAPLRTAVIYDQRENLNQLITSYGLEKKFHVVVSQDVQAVLGDKAARLQGIDAVFLCGVHSHERNIILKYCIANNIQVYLIPRIGDVLMSSAKPLHLFHLPILRVGRYAPAPEYVFCKRAFDILVSATALLVLSPVLLLVTIAIRAYDHGPALYKQCRLTKDGKQFYVLKFRSMRVDAEKDGVARLSTGDKDDRITPVGRFIRRYRLDELPQLLNILKGDMSLVGPRPERPEIAAEYAKTLPEFSLRLQAKAGLTGYAQVYGKYNTTPYDKLQMDLMYIANPGIAEDLKIIFATIKILFEAESTEGVAQGQTTAQGTSSPSVPEQGDSV